MPVDIAMLHLARLHLDSGRLVELGKRRRLPLWAVDTGYLVHCMLGELFGDAAPAPFAIGKSHGRALEVLAYTDRDRDTLRCQADAFADPWVHAAADWDAFELKRMPEAWPAGFRVAFTARVCPVVRVARGSTTHRPGAELDAFLARCDAAGKDARVVREDVYVDWFASRLPTDAARLVGARIEAFQLERMVRRDHGEQRKASVHTRPDVRIAGEIEVVDGFAFDALLRRGIGRHRAFGFGMLLLRRPR